MSNFFGDVRQRLYDQINDVYTLANLHEWISKKTYLDSELFSFKDHEFQMAILADPSNESNCVKCAQVGLSELSYRWAVAACCTQENFTVIYTFPAAADAETNNRTRVDPMIKGSPELSRLVNPDLNNSAMKQFGTNSFLFFRGTRSETQALSIPANAVIHDEYDKSDIAQASVYASRLQHKPHKIRKRFSTPTVDNYGITEAAKTSKRMRYMSKCVHCNHHFLPDYFEDIVIPGFDGKKEEITRKNLHKVRWRDAWLKCPKCGQDPELHHTRQEYVCENPSEDHVANTWYVTPFSVPNIILPSYLVQQSTTYEKFSEFKNQSLGLTAEDEQEAILPSDIRGRLIKGENLGGGEPMYMGADLGLQCAITIGREGAHGEILLVHKEKVHYTQFEERTLELKKLYNINGSLSDYQPYTELITRLSLTRDNFWGAMFNTTKGAGMFKLVPVGSEQQEVDEAPEGLTMNHVKIGRTLALDTLLRRIKEGNLIIQSNDQDDEYIAEMTSLKRIQVWDKSKELIYSWVKTNGEDHYHFATLYMMIAIYMRKLLAAPLSAATVGIPGLIVVRPKKQERTAWGSSHNS